MIPWLLTASTVFSIYWLESRNSKFLTVVFSWVPAILLAYLIPATLSWLLNWDFSNDAIHLWSRKIFIPLALVTVMSSLSISQLKSVGFRPIVLFVCGSLWIAVFPILIFALNFYLFPEISLFSDLDYWLGIPPIVGSWIGGSTSQLVLKELSACPEHIFLSVLVLDSLLVNIWTILMFQGIKRSDRLNASLGITDQDIPAAIKSSNNPEQLNLITLLLTIGAVFAFQAVAGNFPIQVIGLSITGLLFGNSIKGWSHKLALRIGSKTILVVMAILGLRLQFELLAFDSSFFMFLIVWLIGHFMLMMWIAKRMNLNFAWVPIASMANVGGIATAPAVTAAYKPEWMPHAVLLAILSMATGTFWGMITLWLIKLINP